MPEFVSFSSRCIALALAFTLGFNAFDSAYARADDDKDGAKKTEKKDAAATKPEKESPKKESPKKESPKKEKEPAKKNAEAQAKGKEGKAAAKDKKPRKPPKVTTEKRLDAIEKKLDALADSLTKPAKDEGAAKAEGAKAQAPSATAPPASQRTRTRPGQRPPAAPPAMKLDSAWLEDVNWRSIGPANMSGRITDLAIHDQDPSLWWIATASGGLLKTTNQGVTIEHQFDHEGTISIGAIAADPKNKDVIWVGTGEANPRNSVSYGDGVYKSVDGGKTWKHMGLKKSYQIGRILINPKDTNVVYVGALGRLYGSNRERGVYRTTDGGETWEQVLYVDDNTGVIDMIMHPENPDVVIAALWDRMRDGYDSWPGTAPKTEGIDGYDPIRKWGKGAGLYKTSDGGKKWKKLTNGLPSNNIGRVGLDWQSKSPHAIYAIIDCEDIGKGPKPTAAFLGAVGVDKGGKALITQLLPESPAEKAGVKVGDQLTHIDDQAVKNFDQLLEALGKKKIGDEIALKLKRKNKDVAVKTKLTGRPGTRQPQAAGVWMGVTGEDREGKLVLTAITSGGPSAKAGLKQGDVVAKVDGKKPESYAKLIESIRSKKAGDKVKVNVARGDKQVELTVTLENRPGQRQQPTRSNAVMGIQGEDAEGGGAKLTVITGAGPSEKGGLKPGDVVKKVNDKDLADYQALIGEIRRRQPGDKLKVTVVRGGKNVEKTVTLGDRRGTSSRIRPYTYSYYGQTPNIQDQQGAKGHEYGGVYKSTDAGETWQRVNSLNTRPMYFSVIRVDPSDEQRVYVMGVSQFRSTNGGKTFTPDFGRGVHADSHDLWIDPKDGRHMVIGGDGGFYATYDYGSNWDHINTAAIGQFYHVAISPKKPYWVVGGLQDNGSWAGPAISRAGGAVIQDWISVGGGDGFVCRVDPNDPDLIYYESQNGSMGRRHLKTGERASIRPSQRQGVSYRFNWKTPFILSHQNSKIFYCAGNYVFRSLDRGNNLQAISPEITLTNRGSATALAESPRDPNVMYVGTDDGALWVTKDGGGEWTNITKNLRAPGPRWVATIEASRFASGRVYVCLDGHRSDDDNPYVYVSDDYGASFKPLHRDLPWGSTRCLREDTRSQNLLYLGTEFGFFISVDRGQSWAQANQKLPTVAIHDVAVHPTNGEIVLATHGRSLWACDVTGLRGIDASSFGKDVAFYQPKDVVRWRTAPRRGGTTRRYVASNPARGAQLWYSLPKDVKSVKLRVEDVKGQLISDLDGKKTKGMHGVVWNMTQTAPQNRRPTGAAGGRGAGGRGAGARGGGFRGFRGGGARPVPNGAYRVTLIVDGKPVTSHVLTLQRDPDLPADAIADEEYEARLMQEEAQRRLKSDAKRAGRDVHYDD